MEQKTIKIAQPVYADGTVTVQLITPSNDTADVSIVFDQLVPFANMVAPEVVDFFLLSACSYGIDRFVERRTHSVDGWSRKLKVTFPVTNVKTWTNVKENVESLLSFLTGDYWDVDFCKANFIYPKLPLPPELAGTFSQVNLFSGGLDSLIGAIDFLQSNPTQKLLLASQYDSQMHGPLGDQNDLITELKKEFAGRYACIPSVRVSLLNSALQKETTFRSRSILFIGIAVLAAEAKKIPIVVPENGTVSLNYPLSPSRRSACSTRTTHPTFLSNIRALWSKIGIKTIISNPYEFETKGEMVNNCNNQKFLQSVVGISNSCGKRGHRSHWAHPSATHCGVCMPCVYRQASLLAIKDKTDYGNDINSLPPFKTKKGQDIGACLDYLNAVITPTDIKNELIVNGLRDLQNIGEYVDVVNRTRLELKEWIKKVGDPIVRKKAGI